MPLTPLDAIRPVVREQQRIEPSQDTMPTYPCAHAPADVLPTLPAPRTSVHVDEETHDAEEGQQAAWSRPARLCRPRCTWRLGAQHTASRPASAGAARPRHSGGDNFKAPSDGFTKPTAPDLRESARSSAFDRRASTGQDQEPACFHHASTASDRATDILGTLALALVLPC